MGVVSNVVGECLGWVSLVHDVDGCLIKFSHFLSLFLMLIFQQFVTRKFRARNQVGFTNRWRLTSPLGSDLLGTAQAIRSVNSVLNNSMRTIISGE